MTKQPNFPVAYHDFYKTNGGDYVFNTVGPSLTRQEFLEECDINTLMKRYEMAGAGVNGLPAPADIQPMYVDFTEVPDNLLGYLEMIKNAEEQFMKLPAGVRREFDNSAVAFVDYASNPENLEQMRAWGLAAPAKPQEPAPDAVVSSPAPGQPAAPPASPAPAGGASTHGST